MRKSHSKFRSFKQAGDSADTGVRGTNPSPAGPVRSQPPKSHAGPSHAGSSRAGAAIPTPSVARAHMLYGVHPVTAAWQNPDRVCRHLYATATALAAFGPVIDRVKAQGLRRPAPIVVEREAIDRLLPPGAVHQGLALDGEPLPEVNLHDVLIAASDGPLALIVLDQVTDPHNVGAILRSAAAFGAKAMVVQTRHAPEVTGVLAKSASGAVDAVPIVRETNLARTLETLRDAGIFVLGLAEEGACAIADATFGPRIALILGAEGVGLRRLVAEGCDILASLPTQPPIASLNVSNAAAIGLYEIARRRNI